MEFNELVFFVQLLIVVTLFFSKLFVLMNYEKMTDDFKIPILTLIGMFMAYGIGQVLAILDHSVLFVTIMNYERVLFILGVIFFIGELFLKMDMKARNSVVGARDSSKESRGG